jgi:hypothetical protein
MTAFLNNPVQAIAKSISFENDMLCVDLMDGREINVP